MRSVWFQGFDPLIAGNDHMRPLSLGSMEAMRVMGVTWLDDEASLPLAEEERQILLFDWLHRAPLVEVEQALWSGAWQSITGGDVPDVIVARYRVLRDRLLARVNQIAKPRSRRPPMSCGPVRSTTGSGSSCVICISSAPRPSGICPLSKHSRVTIAACGTQEPGP